jgi:putative flippase GtrA
LGLKVYSIIQEKEVRRFVKFCLVGASGFLVNMFFLWFFTETFKVYYLFSSLIAIELSIISNYVLNDLWTWHDRGKEGRVEYLKRMVQYHISASAGLLTNIAILWFLTEMLHVHYLFSNVFGILAGTFLNFFFNDRWTFRYRKNIGV